MLSLNASRRISTVLNLPLGSIMDAKILQPAQKDPVSEIGGKVGKVIENSTPMLQAQ